MLSHISNRSVLLLAGDKPFGLTLLRSQLLMFGRVAAEALCVPIRRAALDPDSIRPITLPQRRRGRPTETWFHQLHKRALEVVNGDQYALDALLLTPGVGAQNWRAAIGNFICQRATQWRVQTEHPEEQVPI